MPPLYLVDETQRHKAEDFDDALFLELTEEANKGDITDDNIAAVQSSSKEAQIDLSGQNLFELLTSPVIDPVPNQKEIPASDAMQTNLQAAKDTPAIVNVPADNFKHLAEALSGLVESDQNVEQQNSSFGTKKIHPEKINPENVERRTDKLRAGAGFKNVPEPIFTGLDKSEKDSKAKEVETIQLQSKEEVEQGRGQKLMQSSNAVTTGDNHPVLMPQDEVKPNSSGLPADKTITDAGFSAPETAASPARSSGAGMQEPRLAMSEMTSLMTKLEQQVSKASKKLASRAEEIQQRLNKNSETFFEEASQEDKNIEASILVLCDSLASNLNNCRKNCV